MSSSGNSADGGVGCIGVVIRTENVTFEYSMNIGNINVRVDRNILNNP